MPYEHGRKSATIERFAYGRNRSFYRRSVEQVNKSCPTDLQLPELVTPTGQRLPLFTVIFVDTDAFRKACYPLLPDTVESKGFESESPSRMDGHERPSPQLYMVGLQADNTDFTRLYSTCIYSDASSSDQSMNKTPSPLVSPNTPLPCHSTSGNSCGSVCDGGAAVGTDFSVNDLHKVEKRVKRNPRKKGKKKGKQYKRIASRKVSTELDVQCNGNTYSASTFEASNPSPLSSSGKHHFDNNLSDETAPSSLLDSDITLDCPNLFSSTSYSDEMEVPSPHRLAGDESGCNTTTHLHSSCVVDDAEAVPFTSSGSSRKHHFKKNNIHNGNFPRISMDKSWNSDPGENSSDEVATCLLVKDETGLSSSEGEIVPPSEAVTQHDPSSRTITMDLNNLDVEISKDFYNNDSFLSNNVLDERADSNSQVGSNNDFHPVISGRRGRNRRMISDGSSNGANKYTANMHSHTGKDSNFSIWQKVQKFENKGSISKPSDVNVLPSHREVLSKDTKVKTKNNKLVDLKQKQSGMDCRYSSSDATSKLHPSQVSSRGSKTGKNPPKSTDGKSMNGERSKSSSGVKHANQYHQSGTHTGKSDMSHSSKNHFHHKEELQMPSHIHLNNNSDAELMSPCDDLSKRCLSEMTDNVECCLTKPQKEISVRTKETPSENTCNLAYNSILPASCSEISPLPTTSGQFDKKEVETNNENDKTKDTKDIQGHSSVDGEDQQLMKLDYESYKEPNSLTSGRAPVQKWVPVGRKDLAVSINNEAAISQLTSRVAEVEDSSSNNLSFNGKDGEVSCPGANKVTNKFTSYHHSTEVLDYTVTSDQTCEMEDKKFIAFETDLDKIIGAVHDACNFRAIVEGAQVATGSTVADFEEFLFSASPVIQQTQCSRTCNSYPREQLIGNSLCSHQLPSMSLKQIWQWYEEPSCFGLEVKTRDSCSSKRPRNVIAYFVPYLSAVQLFKISRNSRCCNLSGQPALSCHMDRRAKSWSSLGSLPTWSMILPQPHRDMNVCLSEFSSSSQDVSDKNNHVGQEELIFEYFESEQPPRRRSIYDKIKELVNGRTLNDGRVFGDPLLLESVELHDLHPASWYCVAWYPIYRIPDGNFHAAFLTYHSLGHFVHQSALGSVRAASRNLVSPVVGLQTYNDKGENWFRPRDSDSKVVHFEDTPHPDTAELTKERLRTLKQTASVMARAVVRKGNQKSVNRHPDYEFFLSRSW